MIRYSLSSKNGPCVTQKMNGRVATFSTSPSAQRQTFFCRYRQSNDLRRILVHAQDRNAQWVLLGVSIPPYTPFILSHSDDLWIRLIWSLSCFGKAFDLMELSILLLIRERRLTGEAESKKVPLKEISSFTHQPQKVFTASYLKLVRQSFLKVFMLIHSLLWKIIFLWYLNQGNAIPVYHNIDSWPSLDHASIIYDPSPCRGEENRPNMGRREILTGALFLGLLTNASARKAIASEAQDDMTPIYFGNG